MILLLAALLFGSPVRAVEPPLDQQALRAHIVYLADDAREGRAPGTEGGNASAAYISGQMRAAGLKPGAPDGSWYLPVNLVQRKPSGAVASWRTRRSVITLAEGDSSLVARDGNIDIRNAPVLFAGFGLDLPDVGYADLKGVDVKGKIVFLLSGRPEAAIGAPGLEIRRRAITQAGALAVIALTNPADPWPFIRDALQRGKTVSANEVEAPIQGALSYQAWSALLAAAAESPSKLYRAAQKPGFHARSIRLTLDASLTGTVRRYASYNVVGRIDGTTQADQAVFYLAHYDHLGLCGAPDAADRICNGAVDNASGVAELLEIGKRLAHSAPSPRSFYFVATTAEEMGLLGARALAEAPPVPLDRIAAVLNLDTVAIAPAGQPVSIVGRGQSPALDAVIDAAAHAQGRAIDTSEAANAFVKRQDGWEFSQHGVPAAMVGGAFSDPALLAGFLAGRYHSPTDDVAHLIPLDGMAEDGALHVILGRMLADPANFPLSARSSR